MARTRVLVVDDDEDIRRLVVTVLDRHGIEALAVGDGDEALRAFFDRRPGVVVLDLALPGLDGWQLLERIRELSDAPVLLLSAENRESEIVRGLTLGADDYVTKPFGPEELVARITALARRGGAETADPLALSRGELFVDVGRRLVRVGETTVELSPTEFDLLVVLMRNSDQVVTQQQLLEAVWGNRDADPKRVRLYVSYLRRKLDETGGRDLIETVRGLGYRLRDPS